MVRPEFGSAPGRMKLWNRCDQPLDCTARDTSWLPSATQAKVMQDTCAAASACVERRRSAQSAATAPPSEWPAVHSQHVGGHVIVACGGKA